MSLISIRLALCLVLSVLYMTPVHADPLTMQPTSVELRTKPGAQERQILTLTNSGQQERALTIGLADWTLSRDGALELRPPGNGDSPAAAWARFTPAYVSIPPGESRRVIVDIRVPRNGAPAGDTLLALIASAIEPDAQTGMMHKTQLSSLFYITTTPAMSAAAVSDLRLIRSTGEDPVLELDVSNSGNAHARLEGKIVIEAGQDERITLPVSNLVVLPGQQRRFSIPVRQEIPQGSRVTVTLDNIFAPQTDSGVAPVREFSAPLGNVSTR